MPNPSPLRYPGGKHRLAGFIQLAIQNLNMPYCTYVEPFAGGAGVALSLLLDGTVNRIVINDYDKGIWSFWKAILTETDRFIEQLRSIPLNMEEWNRQHEICVNRNDRYSFELGFATFYMNRTNRSGIIKGGVIGGQEQSGDWTMDVRFNREELENRIRNIAKRKKDIKLYNKDINSFLVHYVSIYEENALIYFDPPYYQKGKQLYMNFFKHEDHIRIEKSIRENVIGDWIITYDYAPEIKEIYRDYNLYLYDLNYSASKKCKTSELIILKNGIEPPNNEKLYLKEININIRPLEGEQ